ncbi:YhdP family protein [Simiduia aestuariiviva]|uniref:Uncharacterized protein (TIGR02099 family) n=1 Tax=Simiduia aestuariiviva TaxID=1510459 RepID=A0A839UN64_9GAMM|nr:YhdP family protein [Simiduia aestuariiviva]MBB3169163.1 uncharacterized protein (TIGR02099 family) [Simiduia aestuariiviva]
MRPLAHLFARLWRYFWQLTALLLILCALLVQLGRMAMPMVADYREPLVRYLSAQLALKVEIRTLAGQWDSLMPVLALEGLSVATPAGKPVLTVESALAEVDLLSTLWERQLRFSDVEFLGVRSNLVQASDGRLRLEGLRVADEISAATNYTLDDLRGIFLVGQKVNLIDLQTHVTLQSGHEWAVVVNRLLLEHGNDQHRLSASLQLEDRPEAVQITMEGSGDPFDIDEFGSRAHVRIVDFPTERLLAMVARDFWTGLPEGEWRPGGKATLEAWVNVAPGEGLEGVGNIRLAGLPFELADREIAFQSLAGELVGNWRFDGSWQLQLQNTELQWGSEQHPPFALNASVDTQQHMTFKADRLVLPIWHRWLTDSEILSEPLQSVLDTLSPEGELHQVSVRWPLAQLQDFELAANLSGVSAQAWEGAPAVTGVDGYLRVNKQGGSVDLNSTEGFSMHYTSVYDAPMVYQSARGQVAWWLDRERQSVYINSGPVKFVGDDGQATGFVYIDAPMGRADKTLELLLQIGIEDSAAQYHKKYVPQVVSENLRNWLDSAVDVGQVAQGGFLLHGFLSQEHSKPPTIQLWLDIKQARLDYQPPWPAVKGVDAKLLLDNTRLKVTADRGQIYNSQLGRAEVSLAPDAQGEARLNIDADLMGGLVDTQQLLRDSPLADITNHVFAQWAMAGDYDAAVQLGIPIGSGGEGVQFDVKVALKQGQVHLAPVNISVEQLSGDLRIASDAGVEIKQLSGQLWGEPISFSAGLNGQKVQIKAQTRADIQSLMGWAGAPAQPQFTGVSPYQVLVSAPWRGGASADGSVRVQVTSALTGLSIKLPAPFGKAPTASLPLVIDVPIAGDELIVAGSVGELVDAKLRWQRSDSGTFFERGDVHLLGQARLPKQSMLRVRGQLPSIDASQWHKAFEGQWADLRESETVSSLTAASDGSARTPAAVPIYVTLTTPALSLKAGRPLGESNIEAIKTERAWRINLRNERVAGDLELPYSAASPLDLSLTYLRLPLWAPDAPPIADASLSAIEAEQRQLAMEADKVWAAVEPLPDMRVAIASLYQDEENIGQIRFDAAVRDATLTLSDIKGSLFGLRFVEAEQGAQGGLLVWNHGQQQSAFTGSLSAVDLGEVMTGLAMEKLIESRRADFAMDVRWAGAPTQIQLVGLEGEVGFTIEQGRFLRANASASNALMRLMGIFNFDTWIRRLKLDFSDVYASGMAYDRLWGELVFERGLLTMPSPVSVRTPSSKMQMAGRVNLIENTLDTDLTVNLPVLDNLTFIAAISAGLPVAAGVFVASRLFEKQFEQMTSVNYRVTGSLDDPKMQFMQISDTRNRQNSAKKPSDASQNTSNPTSGDASAPNSSSIEAEQETGEPQTPR